MQRILYCTDSLMAGGTERQLVELVTRLDRRRFEPYVLCLYSQRAGRSLHFKERLNAANIPVHILNLNWNVGAKLRGMAQIVQLIWRIRPQIVHMVNYHSNLLVRLVRPMLPHSIRLLGSIRVEYTRKQLLYERLSNWLCAEVVCNSPHLRRQFPSALLINNGVDLECFSSNPDPELRRRIAPTLRRVVLMLGRISEQKAPHLLIEALGGIDRLPHDIGLFIVGEVDDQAVLRRLQHAIQQHDLSSVVKWFPTTAEPEAFYHATDVTVLPSLWEGCPNVILESLAAGCPVIVSEAANMSGIVRHEVNGWVFPTDDVQALSATLRIVTALPAAKLRGMRSACQAAAAAFPVSKMVREYEELYERLSARS